ncbi:MULTISPECIES: hypothetical protein [unclassified Streptomyces]|uniref:hypothetical protein n=1 Tax=unclassified Streptomyces TaxID=2593676 RepID=UPI0035D54BF0
MAPIFLDGLSTVPEARPVDGRGRAREGTGCRCRDLLTAAHQRLGGPAEPVRDHHGVHRAAGPRELTEARDRPAGQPLPAAPIPASSAVLVLDRPE